MLHDGLLSALRTGHSQLEACIASPVAVKPATMSLQKFLQAKITHKQATHVSWGHEGVCDTVSYALAL